MAVAAKPIKRKRGRPRKSDAINNNQTSEILDVAIDLFRRQGYQQTSMSQIAAAAGYDQSSLYYWFKSKEDIVASILKDTEASLQIASRIVSLPGNKTVQLYSVLYSDMVMMCNSPFDFYDLESVAYSAGESLRPFFTTYQQLADTIHQIIEQGMETGEFIKVNAADVALDALALNEGLQHRYHMNQKNTLYAQQLIGDDAQPLFRSIDKLAHHAARTTIVSVAPNCIPAEVKRLAKDSNWIS